MSQVLYDAAHAFGCRSSPDAKRLGNFGNAEVFSFHATKFYNSGEGGAITTNSEEMAARCRYFRNFAFAGYDLVVGFGTNAKMSEVHAVRRGRRRSTDGAKDRETGAARERRGTEEEERGTRTGQVES